jgi:alkylated DNA repair dioxygenase AlkB
MDRQMSLPITSENASGEQPYPAFTRHSLDDRHSLWSGETPAELGGAPGEEDGADVGFEALWNLHPPDYPEILMHGRMVKTPRWQQAYGTDYRFSQIVNAGLPIPPLLKPCLDWACGAIDRRLNGLLLNWYDGALGHYIGAHRDSTDSMIDGAPIVTISYGGTRSFRLRPWKKRGAGFKDFAAPHGTVFILPYDTNLTWTHEVPRTKAQTDRRISITMRAFEAPA